MKKSPILAIAILLLSFANFTQAMYRPQTRREAMFYAKAEEWMGKANRMEDRVDEWRSHANELKSKLASTEEHLKQAHDKIEQKDKDLNAATHKISCLGDMVEEVLREAISTTREHTELLKKFNQTVEVNNRLAQEVTSLKGQNDELRSKDDKNSKEKKRLSAQFEGEIAGIATVSIQKHQLAVGAIAEIRKELSPLRRQISPLRRQVAEKDAEIARLRAALAASQLK